MPSNSSHLAKNAATVSGLRDSGAVVRALCLDQVLPPVHHSTAGCDDLGIESHVLRVPGFRPSPLWLREYAHRRQLIDRFEDFLRGNRIDVMVAFSAGTFIPAVFMPSIRRAGIPSVLIPDGVVLTMRPGFRRPIREVLGYALRKLLYQWSPRGARQCDRVLLMSDSGRRALLVHEIDPSKLRVVGSPEYDSLSARISSGPPEGAILRTRERLGIPIGRPCLIYAHQHLTPPSEVRVIVSELSRGCRRVGGNLVVKLHPRTRDAETIKQHVASDPTLANSCHVVEREIDTIDLLIASDACATIYSTVALEALICGKPLLLLQNMAHRFQLDFDEAYGVAVSSQRDADMEKAAADILIDERLRDAIVSRIPAALESELGAMDGSSTERSVAEILDAAARHA